MKIIIKIFFCIVLANGTANAQNEGDFLNSRDVTGKRLVDVNKQVAGSPFLNEVWGKGRVEFQNGQQAKDLVLQFDAYANELHFKKDDNVFAFVNPVKYFLMEYVEDQESKIVAYRCGYPATQKKTASSFYQVIADGSKVQLLNYFSKSIREVRTYGGPQTKEFYATREYFVYDDKESSTKNVTLSKAALVKALPAYAEQINKFADEKKYKLKSEKEVSELLMVLNQ